MSRSGYVDDEGYDGQFAMWRGRVLSAARGRRGQAFFRDLVAALDAMPNKRLMDNLVVADGEVCALGAVGQRRGVSLAHLNPEEGDDEDCGTPEKTEAVAEALNIASCLAADVAYQNDEAGPSHETPEGRWARIRRWAVAQIKEPS